MAAFVLSLLPAIFVVILLALGRPGIAALIFVTTFSVISIGTLVPRCRLFGPLVSSFSPKDQEIWLTIDDGPDPASTPQLLDLLDAHGAKAIFFVIGHRVLQHPELAREMLRRGHLIGNHTLSHPAHHFWRLRPWVLWREAAGCQEAVRSVLGTVPHWFRPPVGHHNLFLSCILRALGLKMMIWNCRGFDGVWRDLDKILQQIRKNLRPGAIVLLHDATPVAAEVMRRFLELLTARGLKAVLPPETNVKPC
jgi:peptidoglycan/xylan/chitin deacetylase (PgdA/CDA1 family)